MSFSSDPIDVSIPAALGDYVHRRITAGKFSDASDYVASLIEADRRNKSLAEFERLVTEGLNSGPPIPADDAFWNALHERVIRSSRQS